MDRKDWSAIVTEARDRFDQDVEDIIKADGHEDVAVLTLNLIRRVVRLFADQLATVGLERLP